MDFSTQYIKQIKLAIQFNSFLPDSSRITALPFWPYSFSRTIPPFPPLCTSPSLTPPTMSHEEGISVKDTNNSSSSSNDDYEKGHFGPLAHVNTASSRYPAFGGDLQPGLYRIPKDRKLANPAPLGLCAFALTTFVLGCLNMSVKGITKPNIIVGPALAYGGLVQLLAGMWYVYRTCHRSEL
jgi:hypothetical protein